MSVTDGIGQTPCSLEHYLVYVCVYCFFVCSFLSSFSALTLLVGHQSCKNNVSEITYTVSSGKLHLNQLIRLSIRHFSLLVHWNQACYYSLNGFRDFQWRM